MQENTASVFCKSKGFPRRGIASLTPNPINSRALLDHQGNMQKIRLHVWAHGKEHQKLSQKGQELFFSTNRDLADILGRTDF